MLSKNQSAHSSGSLLINLCANNCKLINHGLKPSDQQQTRATNFSAILVLLHPTSGYSEIHFYFDIHSEIDEIHVSVIVNRYN